MGINMHSSEKLSNEELLERLRQQMYADEGRLEAANKPQFTGKMISPMSSMTQNARQLREQSANKIPKQKKIESLLRREAKGWSPDQTRGMLDMLRRGETSEQLALNRLQKQFGKNFGYEETRGNRLKSKIGKDIGQNLEMSKTNLKNMGDEIKNLESQRSVRGAEHLRKAGDLKTARNEELIKQLEDFGNQEHTLNNLKLRAERDAFEEEKSAPYRKIDMANRSLAGLNVNPQEAHPDKELLQNQLLQKITNAYNHPHQNYPGQRVIGTQPETEAAFSIAQQINPKYKDVFAKDRKAIEQDLLNNPLSEKIYKRIPESVEPLMSNLDVLARKQLKNEAKNIGGHYARQGTYGSNAHKTAVEQALRDVMRRVQEEREGALLTGIRGQKESIGKEEANAMNKYGTMAESGAKEFGNILHQNELLNKLGWKKRANKQGEANEAMQSWYGQLADEWPMLNYGPSYKNVSMEPFENLAKGYNTDLSALFAQPALFSENEKAFNAYQGAENKKIKDYESYILNSQKAKHDSQLAGEMRRQQEIAESNARQAQNNAQMRNAAQQGAGQSHITTEKQKAWDNYQRIAEKTKAWYDRMGWRNPARPANIPQEQLDFVNRMMLNGPGIPAPYAGSRANHMMGYENGALPFKNMGMSRQEFEANPATRAWANPENIWRWG